MKKVLRVLSLCLMSLLTILPTAFAEDPSAAAAAKNAARHAGRSRTRQGGIGHCVYEKLF